MEHIGSTTIKAMNLILNRAADSKGSCKTENNQNINLITFEEAKRKGIRIKSAPPEFGVCEFCKKPLPLPRGIVINNEIIMWQPRPAMCDCKKSQKYWEEYNKKKKEEEEQKAEEEKQKEKQKKINRLLNNSRIKKRFHQLTFENFRCDTQEKTNCYKIAKKYTDNWQSYNEKGIGLYIEGTNGTGKTHLAAAIALELINKGVPVICETSGDLLLDVRNTFNNSYLKEHQVIDMFRQVDLLIVDDFGKEYCSDWSISTLYAIFNGRYEDMKPTIITTNYDDKSLVQALTPNRYDSQKIKAIISRLKETSIVLTMAWKDIRCGD